jgi:hypothetical protein
MFRAFEPWHLLVLMLLFLPVVAVVLVVVRLVKRRRPSPPPWGSVPPAPPSAPVFTDPATGRRYTVDPASGQSVWLDVPPPPE